jgi:phospholipid/cholesterol/gamma-HCH transport system substrate-binding protein
MLTLSVRVKVIVFAVIAVLVIAFVGYRYAGLGPLVGLRGYYVVTVNLPTSGGIYSNADVTYRGVSVGRVGALRLTDDGIQADLQITNGTAKIPVNAEAVVTNLSAVGEQYLDLRPTNNSGPYLTNGSIIAVTQTRTPIPVQTLLVSIDSFANSVPTQSLQTVVTELHAALRNQGPNLQILLDTTGAFVQAADENLPATTALIVDGRTVLKTQADQSAALVSFGQSAKLFARQLASSDPDLRRLIAATPGAMVQISGLLMDTDPGLSIMMANLLTTANVVQTRSGALNEILSKVPRAVAIGSSVVQGNSFNLGMAVTFFNPLPCMAGYGGTDYRNGLDTTPQAPLNTAAKCTTPPSTGTLVRGSANAPYGGGVPPAVNPPLAGTAAAPTGSSLSSNGMAGLLGVAN